MRAALALVALSALLGQQPARDAAVVAPRPTGTASITGTVVSSDGTNEPIRRARVVLSSPDGGGVRVDATADNGTFVFRNLPAGRYQLSAFKDAWLTTSFGAARPGRPGTPIVVADGATLNGLTLRMTRGGVITGVIRDVTGQPAAGVRVRVNRLSVRNGERSFDGVETGNGDAIKTDDTGTYRIFGLPPGDFIISASFESAITFFRDDGGSFRQVTAADVSRANLLLQQPGSAMPAPGVPVKPAIAFYPGTADPAGAAIISLAAGEERAGADFNMPLVPTAHVEGIVTDSNGIPQPRNAIIAVSGGTQLNGLTGLNGGALTSSTDNDGRYEFFGLAPGEYTLMGGDGNKTWTEAGIVVSGSGQDLNVPLTTQPFLTMSGRTVFEGGPAPSGRMRYSAVATGKLASFLAMAVGGSLDPGDNNTFSADIVPGKYQLKFTDVPAGWYPKSAIARGQETFDEPVEIGPGDRSTEFVVTFTRHPSELSGSLVDATGRPASDYFVIVFSTDRKFWTEPSRRVVQVRPANDGAFSVKALPAGEYFIAAVTDLEPGESLTPELLASIVATSVRVTIVDGQRTVQPLKIGGLFF